MDEDKLYLNEFSAYLISEDRSPVTVYGYLGDVRLVARWYQEHYDEPLTPDALASDVIRAYRQYLLDRLAMPKTVNRRLAALAVYAQWAMGVGHMETSRNPVIGVKVVRQASLAPKWLDRNERARLLRAMEKDVDTAVRRFPRLQMAHRRDAAILCLILNTGLRVKEVVALKLNDVQVNHRGGVVVVREGKGAKRREIPINAQARKALQDYLSTRPDVGRDEFFLGQGSVGVQAKTVQRAIARFADAAGLEKVTPHALRHSFAKSLIDKGVSLEKVAALLGHTNLNTTQIYTVPGEKDLEDAVGMLDDG